MGNSGILPKNALGPPRPLSEFFECFNKKFKLCGTAVSIILFCIPWNGCSPRLSRFPPSEDAGFKPGSIHDAAVLSFWTDTLRCGPWVENILKFGYDIPFISLPDVYEEVNNASVVQNPGVVAEIVRDLARQGVVSFTDARPHCVSPLGLVTRKIDGVEKHRLVFDASRCINLHTSPPPVKLVHLARAVQMTRRGDYQVVFDLSSAYYHVKIAAHHVKYLGAAVMLGGKKQYFVFKHLPFGLNSAVHAITKLWKPILAYLHTSGVRCSIYIDDGRILASDASTLESQRLFVYDVIRKAGWQLAEDKSDGPLEGAKLKKYLGFLIDSDSMLVSVPDSKLRDVVAFATESLTCSVLPIKKLSSLLGKIIALLPSHGSMVRICTRSGYIMLESHVALHGWQGSVMWSPEAWREISFFGKHAFLFNGLRMMDDLTDVRVDVLLDNPLLSLPNASVPIGVNHVAVSDASNVRAAVKWLQGPRQGSVSMFQFSVEEAEQSSGERELLAILRFLQHDLAQQTLFRANVVWLTDSSNVVSFLTKGSPKPGIQSKTFEILSITTKLQCILSPVHLYREDDRIRQVDSLSKSKDSDNWSIDSSSFARLHDQFQFTIDLFADVNNRKIKSFVSNFYHPDAVATDAFSIPWVGVCFICPPVALLLAVIRRIKNSRCEGVLVFPNWPASDFYCEIFQPHGTVSPFRLVEEFAPYIIQNEGATHTPLFGKTSFTFFAVYFNTL